MGKKILVTGGAGFIGSNLLRYFNLRSPDVAVRCLDDFSSGSPQNLAGLEVETVDGSILDLELLKTISQGVDSIVHLAAIGSVPRSVSSPRPTHEANVTGTFNVLEAARANGVQHTVMASSSSVYGANPSLPKSEFDWVNPMSPYAASKLALEAYASAFSHSYGLKNITFRFFNVYGPRQRADHVYAAVIPRFIHAALSNQTVQVYGDGLQSRDFTYVDSICTAIHEACVREVRHSLPLNLAFGTRTTIKELIEMLGDILGEPLKVEYLDPRPGDIRATEADPAQMQGLLGVAKPTDFFSGLKKTVQWFQSDF